MFTFTSRFITLRTVLNEIYRSRRNSRNNNLKVQSKEDRNMKEQKVIIKNYFYNK